MCKSLNSDFCVFLETYPKKTQCVGLIDAHVMWSTFQKSNLYVFNEYIILKHLWQVYVTVWAKTHFLDNSSRCKRSYRNIMFHFMLCSSFLCYDKAFVLTSDKREPETKGQRMEDYRQFVILKHFTFHQSLSLYIYSICTSALVPRKMSFSLKHWHCTVNYFTCICACFGIITVFNFIICQNVVCLNPKGDRVVIEHI